MKHKKNKIKGVRKSVKKSVKCLKDISIALLLIVIFTSLFYFFHMNNKNNLTEKQEKQVDEIKEIIRPSAVSGYFYPSNKQELRSMIMKFLKEGKGEKLKDVRALICPHAGYVYSGPIAGSCYKQIMNRTYDKVIILAPSHTLYFKGVSVFNGTHYITPLGKVRIDPEINNLYRYDIINYVPLAHLKEHSIEVQLPFLQVTLTNFTILPLLLSDVDPEKLAQIIINLIDSSTLIIVSSDFSHYYDYKTAKEKDKVCAEAIKNLNFTLMNKCEACGKKAILTLMYVAKHFKWNPIVIDARNSGDTQGNKQRVVGYMAIAFTSQTNYNNKEKEFLLKLARKTLESYYNNSKINISKEKVREVSERLLENRGCFVTLTKHNNLRGCIGYIYPLKPLYQCVMENVLNAALKDRRFKPVTKDELKDIDIEISILSVPEKIDYKDYRDLLRKINRDQGIIIKKGFYSATYLPQVWEHFNTKEEFLSSLCRKAMLSKDCWKSNIDVYYYTAEVFSEND